MSGGLTKDVARECVYRVNEAVGARLLVLVHLVDHQEHHTHQEGQGTDHQQGHLEETSAAQHLCHTSVEGRQKIYASFKSGNRIHLFV